MAAWIGLGFGVLAFVLVQPTHAAVVEYFASFLILVALLLGVLGGTLGVLVSVARLDLRVAAMCAVPPVLLIGFVVLVVATADWQ